MTSTFLLPDLGEGLTEADVVGWLVKEGDTVAVDQVVVEVETAKAVVEVPSPFAGVVQRLHAAAGETVEVGKPLITVGVSTGSTDGTGSTADGERYREEEQAGSGNVLIGYGTSVSAGSGRRRRPRATAVGAEVEPVETGASPNRPVRVISPLVRKLARDNGVDVRTLEPTGFNGIVVKADVERAIAGVVSTSSTNEPAVEPVATPTQGERRTRLTGIRKATADALSRSRREIPEATVWVDVDATALWELRESVPGPGLMAYLARFVVAGLKAYPVLNARVDGDEIVEYDRIDLGIAVQGERGLIVPAIHDAGSMATYALDDAIRDLTARARAGKATPQELSSGTFTLNNYGSFGVDGSAAIINHPQVAILGFGRIIDKPWVVDGELAIRKMTTMSFVFDHRVCDGGVAAGFMRLVADAIENPAAMIARL